jgi:hypothetical protein
VPLRDRFHRDRHDRDALGVAGCTRIQNRPHEARPIVMIEPARARTRSQALLTDATSSYVPSRAWTTIRTRQPPLPECPRGGNADDLDDSRAVPRRHVLMAIPSADSRLIAHGGGGPSLRADLPRIAAAGRDARNRVDVGHPLSHPADLLGRLPPRSIPRGGQLRSAAGAYW